MERDRREFDQRHHVILDVHISNDPDPRLDQMIGLLKGLKAGQGQIMAGQQDIDAAVAQIGLDVDGLTAAGVRIADAIAALQAQGVDTTALEAAMASLDTAVGSVASIVPAP